MKIKIETKDIKLKIDANNGFDAVKQFFSMIINKKVPLEKLGLIGLWYRADGEIIPFRIMPSLYKAGIINIESYQATMENAGLWDGLDNALDICEKDKWMIE